MKLSKKAKANILQSEKEIREGKTISLKELKLKWGNRKNIYE